MGIISSSSKDKDTKGEEILDKTSEKVLTDNLKNHKNVKKQNKNKKNKNKNSRTISTNITKNIFGNKIINTKKTSAFDFKTFKVKRPRSKEKPKIKMNKEIKNIIFQNKKRKAVSQDKKNTKTHFNIKTENKKNNINYNNYNHFSKSIDEEDFDIIYNDNDEDFFENSEDIINKNKISLNNNVNINNTRIQNKILKEKINNTKKKIINLRKKLNTEINNSSKNMNVKNKIKNDIILTNTKTNNNIKPNKINNTIYINNSNITINNTDRYFRKKKIIRKKSNNSITSKENNKEYNNNTYINSTFKSIEIDELIKNTFQEKKINKKVNQNKSINESSNVSPNFYYSESDLDFQPIKSKKGYDKNFSLSQYESNTKKTIDNNIINKMEKLKEEIKSKINNSNTQSYTRTTYPSFNYNNNDNKEISKIKKNETLDNKHIKKNIPSYRRSYSKSNNMHTTSLNWMLESLEKKEKINDKNYPKSLLNSNSKKRKMKSNYFSFKRREKNNSKNFRYSKENGNRNNTSTKKITNIESLSDIKKIKNKKLYNLITQNIIDQETNKNNNINTNDIDQILLVKYRDAVDIDISSINFKESLIDKDLIEANINNKIIINFSKLENITTSQILFDGIIYKVVDNCSNNSNKKFKMMERYFQLKKNCFKYYNNIQLARYNQEKPLVQFDIRHIQDLKIIDKKIFDEYNLSRNKIEYSFAVFLNQNSDFFVFVLDNENFGNSIFGLMNLLKNYYEDKKNYNI